MNWAREVEKESEDLAERELQRQLGELGTWAQEQLGCPITLEQSTFFFHSTSITWDSGGGVKLGLVAFGEPELAIPALRRLVENQAAAARPK